VKRKYLIDGYNLLYQFEELRRRMEYDLESAREGMVLRLSGFALRKSVDVTVVFDGSGEPIPSPSRVRGIQIYFTKPPLKADPVIKRMIAERKKADDLVVVTSDREIESFARLCGVKVETSQAFARALQQNPSTEMEKKIDHTLSEQEVKEWMNLFRRDSPKKPE
jgi:predicted RNA-binding protein with PIN domain